MIGGPVPKNRKVGAPSEPRYENSIVSMLLSDTPKSFLAISPSHNDFTVETVMPDSPFGISQLMQLLQ